MREILFRGKRLDNSTWVEGAFCMKDCDDPFGEMVDRPSIIKYDPPLDGFWYRVDPETVGQFVGLTDKNGKRIFEGDICRTMVCDMSVIKDCGVVCYDSMGMLGLKRVDDVFSDFFFHVDIGHVDAYSIEVIGNIHDNPELLEE